MYNIGTFIADNEDKTFVHGTAEFTLDGKTQRIKCCIMKQLDHLMSKKRGTDEPNYNQILIQSAHCHKAFRAVYIDGSEDSAEAQQVIGVPLTMSARWNQRNPKQKKVIRYKFA